MILTLDQFIHLGCLKCQKSEGVLTTQTLFHTPPRSQSADPDGLWRRNNCRETHRTARGGDVFLDLDPGFRRHLTIPCHRIAEAAIAHHLETSLRQGISVIDSVDSGFYWFDQSNSSSDEDRSRWHCFADFS